MLARIHLTTSAAAALLMRALAEANCEVVRCDRKTVAVVKASPDDVVDRDQAKLELLFFVRAWAADHPGVAATLDV